MHAMAQKPVSEVWCPFTLKERVLPTCTCTFKISSILYCCMQAIQDVEATIGLEGYRAWDGGVCTLSKVKLLHTVIETGLNMHDCLQAWLLHP